MQIPFIKYTPHCQPPFKLNNTRNVRGGFIILLILAGRLPELFKGSIGTDDKLICHGS